METDTVTTDAADIKSWYGPQGAMLNGEILPSVQESVVLVMRDLQAIPKTHDNASQHFKYRSIEDVVNELHVVMSKHGLLIMPSVVAMREGERIINGKPWASVHVQVAFTFIGPRGDRLCFTNDAGIETSAFVAMGEGLDNGDKATAKAWTNAWKNMLLYVFMIPTKEMAATDIDAYSPGGDDGPQQGAAKSQATSRPQAPPRPAPDPNIERRQAAPAPQPTDVLGDNGEVIGFVSKPEHNATAPAQQPPAVPTNVGHAGVNVDELKADVMDALANRKLNNRQMARFAGLFFHPLKTADATIGDWQRLVNFIEWLPKEQTASFLASPAALIEAWGKVKPAPPSAQPTVMPSEADLFDTLLPPVERPRQPGKPVSRPRPAA